MADPVSSSSQPPQITLIASAPTNDSDASRCSSGVFEDSATSQGESAPSRQRWVAVVNELLTTERRFQAEMCALVREFLDNPMPAGFPTEKVLLNLPDVCAASRRLLDDLEAVAESGHVGGVFLQHGPSISAAFLAYCRGVKSATKKAEALQSAGKFAAGIASRMEALAPGSGFRLDSFLIKPLQRITKYPLLLREMIKLKCPQPDAVNQAHDAIKAILDRVNEDVRVHEMLSRYLAPGEWEPPQRPRLDSILHTLDKKSGRLTALLHERLSGQGSLTADPELQECIYRFASCRQLTSISLERCKRVTKQCNRSLLQLAEVHRNLGAMAVTPGGTPMLDDCAAAISSCEELRQLGWRFLDDAEKHVFDPLRSLAECYLGPQRLIDACENKRLDLERERRRSQLDPQAEEAARQVFEALGGRLKEELPELTSHAMRLLHRCLACFMRLLQLVHSRTAQSLALLGNPADGPCPEASSRESLLTVQMLAAWMKRLNEMATFADAELLNDGGGAGVRGDLPDEDFPESVGPPAGFLTSLRQSDEIRAKLVGKYSRNQLRRVSRDHFKNPGPHEINACQGDLVAVLIPAYPSRRTHSLVDSGMATGLLPADLLTTKELGPAMPRPALAAKPTTIWYVELDIVFPQLRQQQLLPPPPAYTATDEPPAIFKQSLPLPQAPPLPPLPASLSVSLPPLPASCLAGQQQQQGYEEDDLESMLESYVEAVSLDDILDQI